MSNQTDRLTLLSVDVDNGKINPTQYLTMYENLQQQLFSEPYPKVRNRCHIVIIGGGIVGLLTAFYLLQSGFQVTVLDQKSFGAAASGRNGGGILALGRDLPEIPFIKLSLSLWQRLTELGIDTKFLRSGHIMIAMNEIEEQRLKQAQQLYDAAGLETKYLVPNEIVSLVPHVTPDNLGGLHSPIDAQAYPFTVVSSLMKWLIERGVRFVPHCAVNDFDIVHSRMNAVKTGLGTIHADAFVLCTGPWTEKIGQKLDCVFPIMARRSQIMVTEILKNRVIHPFISGNGLYLRQTHAGNIVYGGGGEWEKTGFDVSNSIEAIEILSTRFVEMFPNFRNVNLLRAFAGTVEITLNHQPLFGRIPQYENVFISAGYNGHGFGLAPVAGRSLTEIITSHFNQTALPNKFKDTLSAVFPLIG